MHSFPILCNTSSTLRVPSMTTLISSFKPPPPHPPTTPTPTWLKYILHPFLPYPTSVTLATGWMGWLHGYLFHNHLLHRRSRRILAAFASPSPTGGGYVTREAEECRGGFLSLSLFFLIFQSPDLVLWVSWSASGTTLENTSLFGYVLLLCEKQKNECCSLICI